MFVFITEFLCGVGVFLFALVLLNEGIGHENIKLTPKIKTRIQNSFFDVFIGLIAAGTMQSSSAVNSILVGLAEKKIITQKNGYFICMGANIGTTITAYIALLSNINMTNLLIAMIFFGALTFMIFPQKQVKDIAIFTCYFSLIFIGLYIVNKSLPYLMTKIDLNMFRKTNLLTLFALSTLITAVCQSSSLISVLIVTIAGFGLLDIDSAIVMIMGANIGTCSTPLLASIGKSKIGLKVAVFNLIFNIIGCILNTFLYFTGLMDIIFTSEIPLATKIALFHTLYNATTTLLIFPFLHCENPFKIKAFREKKKLKKTFDHNANVAGSINKIRIFKSNNKNARNNYRA